MPMANQAGIRRFSALAGEDMSNDKQNTQVQLRKPRRGKVQGALSRDKKGRLDNNGGTTSVKKPGTEKTVGLKRQFRISHGVIHQESITNPPKSISRQGSSKRGITCGSETPLSSGDRPLEMRLRSSGHSELMKSPGGKCLKFDQLMANTEETCFPTMSYCEGKLAKTAVQLENSPLLSTAKGAFIRQLPQQLLGPQVLLHNRKKPAIPVKVRVLRTHRKTKVAKRNISLPPIQDSAVSFRVYQVQKPKDHEQRRIIATERLDTLGLKHGGITKPVGNSELLAKQNQVYNSDLKGRRHLVAGTCSPETQDTCREHGVTTRYSSDSNGQEFGGDQKSEVSRDASSLCSLAQQDLPILSDAYPKQNERKPQHGKDVSNGNGFFCCLRPPLQCESVVRDTPCSNLLLESANVVEPRLADGLTVLSARDRENCHSPGAQNDSVAKLPTSQSQCGEMMPAHARHFSAADALRGESERREIRQYFACGTSSRYFGCPLLEEAPEHECRIVDKEGWASCPCLKRSVFGFQDEERENTYQALPLNPSKAVEEVHNNLVSANQLIDSAQHETLVQTGISMQSKGTDVEVKVPSLRSSRSGQHHSVGPLANEPEQSLVSRQATDSTVVDRFASCLGFNRGNVSCVPSTEVPEDSAIVQPLIKPPHHCPPLSLQGLKHVPVKVRLLKRRFESQRKPRWSSRLADFEGVSEPLADEPIRFSVVQVQSLRDKESRRLVAFRGPVHPKQITEVLRQRQLVRRFDYESDPQSCEDAFRRLCVPRESSQCSSLHSDVTIGFQHRTVQRKLEDSKETPSLPSLTTSLRVPRRPTRGVSLKALQVAERALSRIATRAAHIQECQLVKFVKTTSDDKRETSESLVFSGDDKECHSSNTINYDESHKVDAKTPDGGTFACEGDTCGIWAYLKCSAKASNDCTTDDMEQHLGEQPFSAKHIEGLTSRIGSSLIETGDADEPGEVSSRSVQNFHTMCAANCLPMTAASSACPWVASKKTEFQTKPQSSLEIPESPSGSVEGLPLDRANSRAQLAEDSFTVQQRETVDTLAQSQSSWSRLHQLHHFAPHNFDESGTPEVASPVPFESLSPEDQESVRKMMLQKEGIICLGGSFAYAEPCGEYCDPSTKQHQIKTYLDEASSVSSLSQSNEQCKCAPLCSACVDDKF